MTIRIRRRSGVLRTLRPFTWLDFPAGLALPRQRIIGIWQITIVITYARKPVKVTV